MKLRLSRLQAIAIPSIPRARVRIAVTGCANTWRCRPPSRNRSCRTIPAFRSLSPDKQNHLLDRLRKFNSQPPEKKAQILNRMETFEHMTPEQQQTARSLYCRYRSLPEDQKAKISQAYRQLRGMPPSAREQLLNSDEFRNNFTDDERDLLRGMADLNVGPAKIARMGFRRQALFQPSL